MAEKDLTTVQTGSSGAQVDAARLRQPPESLRDLSPDELKKAERKLVRKLDLRLIIPLIVMYIMNYLDRSVAFASWSTTH